MIYLNRVQARKFDSQMTEEYKISIDMLMEESGRRVAEFVRGYLPKHKKILICVGKGNNGGDALSSIRHLLNFGYEIDIYILSSELKPIPQKYYEICKKLPINILKSIEELEQNLPKYNLVIDALLGFNFKGELREPYKEIVKILNSSKKSILSLDIPTGIDCDEGEVGESIRAQNILFMGCAKLGCYELEVKQFLADIGAPKQVYEKFEIDASQLFSKNITQLK